MNREQINENIKRRLYAESMGRCMNPNCQKEFFSRKPSENILITCKPPDSRNDAAFKGCYQIVIKRHF